MPPLTAASRAKPRQAAARPLPGSSRSKSRSRAHPLPPPASLTRQLAGSEAGHATALPGRPGTHTCLTRTGPAVCLLGWPAGWLTGEARQTKRVTIISSTALSVFATPCACVQHGGDDVVGALRRQEYTRRHASDPKEPRVPTAPTAPPCAPLPTPFGPPGPWLALAGAMRTATAPLLPLLLCLSAAYGALSSLSREVLIVSTPKCPYLCRSSGGCVHLNKSQILAVKKDIFGNSLKIISFVESFAHFIFYTWKYINQPAVFLVNAIANEMVVKTSMLIAQGPSQRPPYI